MSAESAVFACKYCDKVCKSLRGLTQHLGWSQKCSEAQRLEVSVEDLHPEAVPEDGPIGTEARSPARRRKSKAGGKTASKRR